MKVFYITMILLINGSFARAASGDLDTWNSIINSQVNDEACSAVSDDCGPSKEELKILQTKKFNESKVALKKQEPIIVKAPLKTKKKEIAANKEKMNIKSNLNSEKKEKADYSKIAAAMAIIMSFGFTLNYFHRKRRKK